MTSQKKTEAIQIRLTPDERDMLRRQIARRQERVGSEPIITQGSHFRWLLREYEKRASESEEAEEDPDPAPEQIHVAPGPCTPALPDEPEEPPERLRYVERDDARRAPHTWVLVPKSGRRCSACETWEFSAGAQEGCPGAPPRLPTSAMERAVNPEVRRIDTLRTLRGTAP